MALTKITGELIETSPTLSTSITLTSTDAGSSAGPDLILYRNSSSPADSDYLGQIQFKGRHDGSGDEIYAKVTGKISDASSGTEDGLIETAVKGNGSFVIVSRQKSDKLQLLNGVGLEVDGNVLMGTTSSTAGDGTNIELSASTSSRIILASTGSGGRKFTMATGTAGSLDFYDYTASAYRMRIDGSGHITPGADGTQDLGTNSKRWRNVYSADLQLSNVDTGGNDVDGSEGSWTIQEGENDLFIINRKNGKKYKFSLEEIK